MLDKFTKIDKEAKQDPDLSESIPEGYSILVDSESAASNEKEVDAAISLIKYIQKNTKDGKLFGKFDCKIESDFGFTSVYVKSGDVSAASKAILDQLSSPEAKSDQKAKANEKRQRTLAANKEKRARLKEAEAIKQKYYDDFPNLSIEDQYKVAKKIAETKDPDHVGPSWITSTLVDMGVSFKDDESFAKYFEVASKDFPEFEQTYLVRDSLDQFERVKEPRKGNPGSKSLDDVGPKAESKPEPKSSKYDESSYRAIKDPKNTQILKPLFKDSDEIEYAGQKLYLKDGKVYIPKDASIVAKLITELKKAYKTFSIDEFADVVLFSKRKIYLVTYSGRYRAVFDDHGNNITKQIFNEARNDKNYYGDPLKYISDNYDVIRCDGKKKYEEISGFKFK